MTRNSREAAVVNSLGRQPQVRDRADRREPRRGGRSVCHPFGVHAGFRLSSRGLRPGLLTAVPSGLLLVLFFAVPAVAQTSPKWAKELEKVAIIEHPGAQVPPDLPFVDTDGRAVKLGDFFDGRRPVILTLNYSNCPVLCIQQLNGLVAGIRDMPWDLGDKYQIVTVSIDPKETPAKAADRRAKYLKDYGREVADPAWHFLTGREENIQQLADTVGFGYAYIPEDDQYAHMAVLILCSPEGRVSRYIGGVKFDPQTLKLSLVEAGEGRVGSAMDLVLMYCYHFDPESNRYGPSALAVVRIGGALTAFSLGGFLSVLWIRDARRKRAAAKEAAR